MVDYQFNKNGVWKYFTAAETARIRARISLESRQNKECFSDNCRAIILFSARSWARFCQNYHYFRLIPMVFRCVARSKSRFFQNRAGIDVTISRSISRQIKKPSHYLIE